jgi:murein L,D-transpeptidase YafK
MVDTTGTGGTMKFALNAIPRKPDLYVPPAIITSCLGAFCLSAAAALANDPPLLPEIAGAGPEAALVRTLHEILGSRMDSAMNRIDQLIKSNPNFRLAHLIRGDLLLARARPISNVGDAHGVPQQHLAGLREEALARIQRYRKAVAPNTAPKYLLQMPPGQKYALIADTRASRLYVYQNIEGQARYVADYYISSGKNGSRKLKEGDKKTPVGVYFITANLPRNKLTEFYGSGAFPINYPNEWDKRHKRNGFGIWLHGTPSSTYSRPPRASEGCLVLSNQDLDAVGTAMQVGITPIIISDEVEWEKPGETIVLREQLALNLENWRRDWESGNIEAYVAHYGRDFSNGNQNLADWIKHKRQVMAANSRIKVDVRNIGMFLYPGRSDLVVVNFDQEYISNNFSDKMKKRQYWIREGKPGQWKIIHESAA